MKHKLLTIIALLAMMVALIGVASATEISLLRDGKLLGEPTVVKSNDRFNVSLTITLLRDDSVGRSDPIDLAKTGCTPIANCNVLDFNITPIKPNFTVTQFPTMTQADSVRVEVNAPISRQPGTKYSFFIGVGPLGDPPIPAQASRTLILQGRFITGTKFNDIDGNGIRGATEPGLPGWTIILRNASTGVEVARTVTDANGKYEFKGQQIEIRDPLDPQGRVIGIEFLGFRGTFTVEEVPQPEAGWVQTFPPAPGTHTTPIIDTENVTGLDFGNMIPRLNISGMKFNDENGDGIKGATEPGLEGWTIILRNASTGAEIARTQTDANGNYKFTNLTPGTYTVEEVLQPGWTQTFPTPIPPGTHTVILTNVSVTDRDFGNSPPPVGKPGKCIGWGELSKPSAKFNIFAFTPNNFSGPQGDVMFEQAGTTIVSTRIDSVNSSTDKTSCTITGLARVNGGPTVTFTVNVEDHATPGKGADKFGISAGPFTRAKELLSFGNIKIVK